MLPFISVVGGLIILSSLILLFLVSRYKRCPSDKILVVYGQTGGGRSAQCIHGGAAFIWPVIQDYAYLDLTPISVETELENVLTNNGEHIDMSSKLVVGISDEEGIMTNAADRLLGLPMDSIRDLAQDIIFGQMRLVVAMMDMEEINADRDKFYQNVASNVGLELKKIGLKLISVQIKSIKPHVANMDKFVHEIAEKAMQQAQQLAKEGLSNGSVDESAAKLLELIKISVLSLKESKQYA